jgi:DeoR/GlpR family transcriptional regulator of sugar metabolism
MTQRPKRTAEREAARDKMRERLWEFAQREGVFTLEEAARACKVSVVTAGRRFVELAQEGKVRRNVIRTTTRHVEFEVLE